MTMVSQYTFAGDYTGTPHVWYMLGLSLTPPVVEAIEKAVDEVGKYDAGKSIFRVLKAFIHASACRRLVRHSHLGCKLRAVPDHCG